MKIALQQITRRFSSNAHLKVPVIDVKKFLTQSPGYAEDCKAVADALHKFGVLIIKDPRVDVKANNTFLDMMENYFYKRGETFYKGDAKTDIYPEYNFQVGATPQFSQRAKDHPLLRKDYSPQNKPITRSPPELDAKWRYFWNIGQAEVVQPNKSPDWVPNFKENMDGWGKHMINGCYTVAQMAAIGLGLQRKTFTKMMDKGPHLLAPTGSDLTKYDVGTVFAGFHYDFNFLTIHGKSRYPGLFAWLRTGQKFTVSVPQGHLLLQSGKQFEYLTGGYINCGYHQVVYTQQVKEAKDKAIKQGRIPWRVSSTLFSHIRGDVMLKPLQKFASPEANKKYPPISGHDHALQQLEAINLKR